MNIHYVSTLTNTVGVDLDSSDQMSEYVHLAGDTAYLGLTTHISVHANTLSSPSNLCASICKGHYFHESSVNSVTLMIAGSMLSQEDWSPPWNLLPS